MLLNILNKVSFYALFFTIVLLPIFFFPFLNIPIETSKGLILILGLVISLVAYCAARFSDGKILIPKSYLLLSIFLIPFAFIISSLFSGSIKNSLFGIILDYGTFYFILAVSLLSLVTSLIIKEEKKIKFIFKGLLISTFILFLFQLIHIFLPKVLSFNVLMDKTTNIFGSFNNLAIFAGLFVLITLYILEFINLHKKQKIFLISLLLLSILFIMFANFQLIWKLVGVFSLIIFVYKILIYSASVEEERDKKKFPLASFVIIIISLLFIISGMSIGNLLPNLLQINNFEINPLPSATYNIGKEVFKKDLIFGIGPNKFNEAWNLYKPDIVNYSDFWSSSFIFGFGLFPTFIINTGLLGALCLLVFLVLFLVCGFKNIIFNLRNKENNYIVLSFIIVLYLLISGIFYPIGIVSFIFIFIFLGVFIGLSYHKEENNFKIKYLENPRKSFFHILILILIMTGSLALSFKYIERFVSVFYFQNTFKMISKIDSIENATLYINKAETSINKAVLLNKNDLYFRTYAEVYLLKINNLINSKKELTDQDKINLKLNLDNAVILATEAVKYNSENYLNYQMLGLVHKNYAVLGVEGEGDLSLEAYKKASELNPKNPQLKLQIAEVYNMLGNTKEAKNYAEASILLKDNYLDGLIFLSDLEKTLGNNKEAILYAEKAQFYYPNSEALDNYVNSLKNNTSKAVENNTEEENKEE